MTGTQGETPNQKTKYYDPTTASFELTLKISPPKAGEKNLTYTVTSTPNVEKLQTINWMNFLSDAVVEPTIGTFRLRYSVTDGMQILQSDGFDEDQVKRLMTMLSVTMTDMVNRLVAIGNSLPDKTTLETYAYAILQNACTRMLELDPPAYPRRGFVEVVVADKATFEVKLNELDPSMPGMDFLNQIGVRAGTMTIPEVFQFGGFGLMALTTVKGGKMTLAVQTVQEECFGPYFDALIVSEFKRVIGEKEREAVGAYRDELRSSSDRFVCDAEALEQAFELPTYAKTKND